MDVMEFYKCVMLGQLREIKQKENALRAKRKDADDDMLDSIEMNLEVLAETKSLIKERLEELI